MKNSSRLYVKILFVGCLSVFAGQVLYGQDTTITKIDTTPKVDEASGGQVTTTQIDSNQTKNETIETNTSDTATNSNNPPEGKP